MPDLRLPAAHAPLDKNGLPTDSGLPQSRLSMLTVAVYHIDSVRLRAVRKAAGLTRRHEPTPPAVHNPLANTLAHPSRACAPAPVCISLRATCWVRAWWQLVSALRGCGGVPLVGIGSSGPCTRGGRR